MQNVGGFFVVVWCGLGYFILFLFFLSPTILVSCLLSRVVYVFGPPVKEPPTDVTPTFLTTGVLSTLRQADFEAHTILRESGRYFTLSHGLDCCFKIPANLTRYSYSGTARIYKLLKYLKRSNKLMG